MARLIPHYNMPTADLRGALAGVLEAGAARSGGLGDISKALTSHAATNEERKSKALQDQRLADQLLIQQDQNTRAQQSHDVQMQENANLKQYGQMLSQGPQSTVANQGAYITNNITEEQANSIAINPNDTPDVIKWKEAEQMKLSDMAHKGVSTFQEDRGQTLARIAKEMGANAPASLHAAIDAQRLAEVQARELKLSELGKQEQALSASEGKSIMDMARLTDQADAALNGGSGGSGGTSSNNRADAKEVTTGLAKTLEGVGKYIKDNKVDYKNADVLKDKASKAYNELVLQGVAPVIATQVVNGGLFSKDPEWLGFVSGKADVNLSPTILQNALFASENAKTIAQGSGGGSSNVDPTMNQRNASQSQIASLSAQRAAIEAQKNLVNMTPEEKDTVRMSKVLESLGNIGTTAKKTSSGTTTKNPTNIEEVKEQVKKPSSTNAYKDDGSAMTPKELAAAEKQSLIDGTKIEFEALRDKPDKTSEDWKMLEELGKELDKMTGRTSSYKTEATFNPSLAGTQDPEEIVREEEPMDALANSIQNLRDASAANAEKKRNTMETGPTLEDSWKKSQETDMNLLLEEAQGRRVGWVKPTATEVKQAKDKLRQIYLQNPNKFKELYGPRAVDNIYKK